MDDRKSTTGFAFFMGDNAFTWSSKKQLIVTLSTCEAKYVAASSAVCHALWLRNLLIEIYMVQKGPTKIHVDNKSAIALAKNLVFHDRSKHIDIRFNFIQEHVKNMGIELIFVKSEDQVADFFTKPPKTESFNKLKTLVGMTNPEKLSLGGNVEN